MQFYVAALKRVLFVESVLFCVCPISMRSVSLILFVIHLIASAGLIHFEIGKVQ